MHAGSFVFGYFENVSSCSITTSACVWSILCSRQDGLDALIDCDPDCVVVMHIRVKARLHTHLFWTREQKNVHAG